MSSNVVYVNTAYSAKPPSVNLIVGTTSLRNMAVNDMIRDVKEKVELRVWDRPCGELDNGTMGHLDIRRYRAWRILGMFWDIFEARL